MAAVPSYFLQSPFREESTAPPIDLYETATELVLEADLPGVDPKSLQLTVSDRTIRIQGHCRPRTIQGRYLQMERCHEEFSRPVLLPTAVDPHRAVARYERGVLMITIPKINDRRNRAIQIPIAGS